MKDPAEQGVAGPTQERFRFSLAQLFGGVLILCLILGTFRLLGTAQDSPLASLVIACVGFGGALAVFWCVASKRRRWAESATSIAVTCILIAFLLPAFRYAKERSHRARCPNNLKQIAIALQLYHDEYGSLPPAYVADAGGKPIHSWRVLLLPFLEQEPLYRQYRFDEPWDGPNNRKLHDHYTEIFTCPEQLKQGSGHAIGDTSYVVVVGPRTAFPGDRCVSFGDIRDGLTNTVLVVEIKNSGIHWMEPRDLHVTQMNPRINPPRGQGISSPHKGLRAGRHCRRRGENPQRAAYLQRSDQPAQHRRRSDAMSHTTQHGDPTEAAKPERLRFSLAQLFGFLLAIALVLGTLRLVITIPLWSSWAGGIGFAAAALVFLLAINVKASLIEYAVIIGLVAAWLMPAVHAAKEAPSRMPRPTRNDRVPITEIFALERTAILTTARRRKESLRTIQCHQTWSG